MKHNFWLNLLLILIGVVLGTMVAQLTADISYMSWLSFGLDFGTKSPVVVDLGLFSITFGIRITITVASRIFVALSIWLGRLIMKRY